MNSFIETERLLLREITLEDIDGMYALDSDPEVHTYLGNNPVTDKNQIVDVINFIRQQYVDHGIGRWAIIDKSTNDFIGWTGLKFVKELTNNHINYYDLGYRLRRTYWGKGIATESAIASLAYAFQKLKADAVYAMADTANVGSNNILQKLGMKLIETFDYNGSPSNWYKIERETFEKRQPMGKGI